MISAGKQNQQQCSICTPADEETLITLYNLVNRMKVTKEFSLSRVFDSEDGKTENITFHRLLRMIFNKKYKNFKATFNCKHHHLRREFSLKLNISINDIDIYSDYIAWKMSKYNYHLDILGLQVKNFDRNIPIDSEKLDLHDQKDQLPLLKTLRKKRGLANFSQTKKTEKKKKKNQGKDEYLLNIEKVMRLRESQKQMVIEKSNDENDPRVKKSDMKNKFPDNESRDETTPNPSYQQLPNFFQFMHPSYFHPTTLEWPLSFQPQMSEKN